MKTAITVLFLLSNVPFALAKNCPFPNDDGKFIFELLFSSKKGTTGVFRDASSTSYFDAVKEAQSILGSPLTQKDCSNSPTKVCKWLSQEQLTIKTVTVHFKDDYHKGYCHVGNSKLAKKVRLGNIPCSVPPACTENTTGITHESTVGHPAGTAK